MNKKHNNQLPDNLPQLQNLIKRDPASYRDEFLQQQRHYQSILEIFALQPSDYNKSLNELVMFMAQVAHCYSNELVTFAEQLINILETHNTVLDSDMRMTFCRALILLRHKGLLKPMDLLALFFNLLRCKDKQLRKFLQEHIITDTKNMNAKHKDVKLNRSLQNFMYTMLQDKNAKAAKMSLNIMIELYRKNIWNDAKTVNVISFACFSKITKLIPRVNNVFSKVMVAALKFFITKPIKEDSDESDSSSDDEDVPSTKDVLMANKFNKKTRKREKTLKKVKKVVQKTKKKKKSNINDFNAIHLIHDPQDFAEKLFQRLENMENKGGNKRKTERFEVKLLFWDVISRLIGVHKLFLFNFYPLIQKRLQPHQREATKFLQFVAQATHELIPPDIMEPVLKTLANNFVTEGNSSDVIAIGLNTIRETCQRAPLIMNEDLLKDLVSYKRHRIRSVSMAAQSLIHVYRLSMPNMLHKRDKGRPNEATLEIKALQYGEVDIKHFIPGAEVILEQNDEKNLDEENSNCSEINSEIEENVDDTKLETENLEIITDEPLLKSSDGNFISAHDVVVQRRELAAVVSTTKILSDEDFKKIEAAQMRKQIYISKFWIICRELVNLADIENIYKTKRHDKEARLETVMRGRENREKFGYKDGRLNPFSSKTNREREKKKNFMMIRHKVKTKVKRSFREKQVWIN
ncbi:hypothetical protein PGB90_002948 [Kerria lacca]